MYLTIDFLTKKSGIIIPAIGTINATLVNNQCHNVTVIGINTQTFKSLGNVKTFKIN